LGLMHRPAALVHQRWLAAWSAISALTCARKPALPTVSDLAAVNWELSTVAVARTEVNSLACESNTVCCSSPRPRFTRGTRPPPHCCGSTEWRRSSSRGDGRPRLCRPLVLGMLSVLCTLVGLWSALIEHAYSQAKDRSTIRNRCCKRSGNAALTFAPG